MSKVDVKKQQTTVTNYFTTKPKTPLEQTIELEPEKPSLFANIKPVVSLFRLFSFAQSSIFTESRKSFLVDE